MFLQYGEIGKKEEGFVAAVEAEETALETIEELDSMLVATCRPLTISNGRKRNRASIPTLCVKMDSSYSLRCWILTLLLHE